uniref:DUF4817 domain-containing protein n=1 Tax=Ditylenchus dipsaci TaxID=166011 RepID=A0A915CU21_9BILA
MSFTPQQKAFCVVTFAKKGSPTIVQRKFGLRYGLNAVKPSKQSISRWHNEYLARGSSERKKRVNTKWVRTELKEAEVIEAFRADVNKSTRELALQERTPSKSTVYRILRAAKFHPYKIQLHQKLRPQDRAVRVEHAINQLDLIKATPFFLHDVMFSDECHFHIHGGVNHLKFRNWAQTNPHWFREEPLHSPYLRVWAAIGRRGVVGPFFFEENITGPVYLGMLQQFFFP